jgi:hypothetical protein
MVERASRCVLAVAIALLLHDFVLASQDPAKSCAASDGGHVISVIAYQRPQYFRNLLEALSKCHGIEKYTVLFCLEPSESGVIELAQNFDAAKEVIVQVNPKRLGFNQNIRQGVETGFQYGDFVILLEEDLILAPDALVWFEDAREKYQDDPSVFTVSAYSDNCHHPKERVPPYLHFATGRREHFTPWAWGTWRDRFAEINRTYIGWDMQMNFHAPPPARYGHVHMGKPGLRRDRHEVFPLLSRVNNIGVEGGTHVNDVDPLAMQLQQVYDVSEYTGHQTFAELSQSNDLLPGCPGTKAGFLFGTDTVQRVCWGKERREMEADTR